MIGDSEELARRRSWSSRLREAEERASSDKESAEVAKLRAEPEAFRSRFGRLYDEVLEVLQRHDPIGIAYVEDEYSPEADTILLRIDQAANVDQLRRIIWEVFAWWFGGSRTTWEARLAGAENNVGPEEKYDGIAREIWSLLENRGTSK